jgi:hypothetical protein
MTNVKKHNSNQYSIMKNIQAATILRKKEGRKKRKTKERKKQKTNNRISSDDKTRFSSTSLLLADFVTAMKSHMHSQCHGTLRVSVHKSY